MPPLRVPHKIARLETITRADVFDASSEQLIARGRVVVCLILLLGNYSEPTHPATTTANLILVAYAIFSAGLVVLARDRFLNTSQQLVHFADVATACFLLLLAEGLANPFFVMFIFTLLAATLRWKWQAVVATAVAPPLVLLVASIMNGLTVAAAGGDLNTTLLFGGYLIVIGGMMAYVSALRERSREQFERLAHGPDKKNPGEIAPTLQEILDHTAVVLESPRVLVVWEELEEPYIYWVLWRDGHYQQSRESPGTFGNLVDQSFSKSAFIMADAKSKFLLLSNGPKQVKAPAIHNDLVGRFSIRGVATAPFAGTACAGRIFILDRSSWTDEHLLLTQIMARRTGARLDLLTLQRQNQAAAAMKERLRLTRDLHDGILQNLTAATLQLGLVHKTSDRARLAEVQQLLAKEQRRIREFVDTTCHKVTLVKDALLRTDLQEAVQDAGRYWNCKTSFSIAPDNVTVPQMLTGQLSLIIAEGVANAARHGGASNIDVRMERTNQHLDICIHDDGKGFIGPVKEEHAKPASIRERVCSLGGSLDVTSSSKGVKLAIQIPMP